MRIADIEPRRRHAAARVEDLWRALVSAIQRAWGWEPRVEPFTGYGLAGAASVAEEPPGIGAQHSEQTGWVRVLGRVLLADPRAVDRANWHTDRRGWRYFVTAPAAGEPVRLQIGSVRRDVKSDRSGYIDVKIRVNLAPGWHDVALTTRTGARAIGTVAVVARDCRLGVVADVDDTVVVTAVPRPLLAAWNTFVRHTSTRVAVSGMAGLFRALRDGTLLDRSTGGRDDDADVAEARDGLVHPAATAPEVDPTAPSAQAAGVGVPFVYLSTGAWNTAATLSRFLSRNGFPPGPLLLTDWGPTNTGWFRSGRQHKYSAMARLFAEFPQLRWLLIGDDGQHDPKIYADTAEHFPDRVRAIAIRYLSPTQVMLSHGVRVPLAGVFDRVPEHIPVVTGTDGAELAERLRRVVRGDEG